MPTVVEPDDPEAPGGEELAEVVFPADHLSAHTHDQDYGRPALLTECLIAKPEAVRLDEVLR